MPPVRARGEVLAELRALIASIEGASPPVEESESLAEEKGLSAFVQGATVETDAGPVFEARTDYDGSQIYGKARCSEYLSVLPGDAAYVAQDLTLSYLPPEGALFLDIETAESPRLDESCAFLIGVGFFEGRTLSVRQIFMRSRDEEAASLRRLNEHLARAKYLVTYNGRAFDVPFLAERARIAGVETPIRDMPHLDLLKPSRRIWRGVWENCKLTTLEREVVGLSRRNDVPGRLVPSMYETYRADGDPRKLRALLDHNLYDVATLAPLGARLVATVRRPDALDIEPPPGAFLAAAEFHRRHGRHEDELIALQHAVEGEGDTRRKAMLRLADRHKKAGRVAQARDLWQALIDEARDGGPFEAAAYIEMAKDLERTAKDYVAARKLVIEAITRLAPDDRRLRRDLMHRRDRLAVKIG
ncbi:MAG: ribonuclease H-like domain-containing protein [Deltaproteobacteria bacterium]|nr:ribonuclease H-like domain-containing protein [Deltaproteobacteria bacterium]